MTRHSRKQAQPGPVALLTRGKLRVLYTLVLIIFIGVVVFLARWQIFDHDKFTLLASSRLVRSEREALRGDILAKDGSVLSYSEPKFHIYIYKDDQLGLTAAERAGRQTREEFIRKVAPVINTSTQELTDKLNQNSKWIKIADAVSKDTKETLSKLTTDKDPNLTLDAIKWEESANRIYPEGHLAAHVLGFVGKDEFGLEVGRSGLEQYFDGILRPQKGISNVETDSNQNIIGISNNQFTEARRGATIKTTIDKNIQAKVERHLAEAVAKFGAKSGTVIIIDPRTGEIMSMANYPTYNPNEYNLVSDIKVLGNSAITNPYEIGSVGKIFTMAAAVDRGKVSPNTIVINGHKGCTEIIEGRRICTFDKKPKGPLTATEAMIESDNLALFNTAKLIGSENLADYLIKFGMGKRTNVMLSGEDSGFIKSGAQWNEADLATYSYGHSYFQTTLQAIMGVGALANGGKIMEPLIVKEQTDNDGTTREFMPRVIAEAVSPESCNTMAEILHRVYLKNINEGSYKHLNKYRIGMKSGTALIPYVALNSPINKPGYSNEVNNTYVGYDASPKNTFVMLVNLSEPQTAKQLSFYNARILWLDIFDEIKDDLGVPAVF